MNRPFQERFATGAPDPATTAEVAGIVERALGRPDGGPGFQVECRANVCRVVAPPGIDGQRDWGFTLRRSTEFASRTGEQSISGSGLIMFPSTRSPLGREQSRPRDAAKGLPRRPRSRRMLGKAQTGGSPRRRPLDRRTGQLRRRRAHGPEALPNGIHLSAQGPLAATRAGRCLVDRLRELARRAQVPKHGASAWQPTVFMLPPDGTRACLQTRDEIRPPCEHEGRALAEYLPLPSVAKMMAGSLKKL